MFDLTLNDVEHVKHLMCEKQDLVTVQDIYVLKVICLLVF